MVVFPNCKLNLGLNILQKRGDGFHDLETVFYPLPFHDILEIITAPPGSTSEITLSNSGLPLAGASADNLCVKAFHLLKADFPALPPVLVHLHKSIPLGAGLGGGSADAAFTISMLNTKFELRLSDDQLSAYALRLGSDCPFFLVNKPCLGSSRGEVLEPLDLDLDLYRIVLINPRIHVHTAYAFSQVTPSIPAKRIREIIQQPVREWRETLKNDFEDAIFKQYPEIQKIKEELYGQGALYASMSGSGSTVYGIFEKEKTAKLNFPAHYFVRELVGQAQ